MLKNDNKFIDDFNKKFEENIKKNSSCLIAVSGGVDSAVLFSLVLKLKNKLNLTLGIAHINHNLRTNSKKDADFVKKLASKNNIKFYLKDCTTPAKNNIEAWGRTERYSFLEQISKKEKYNWIITAHNASDEAETLLIKLFSNRDLNFISEVDYKRKLFRPLLTFFKNEIYEFAKTNKIKFIEDESNTSLKYLRNKYRNKIIPYLKKEIDENIENIIFQQALNIKRDQEYISKKVENYMKEMDAIVVLSPKWLKYLQNIDKNEGNSISYRLIELSLLNIVGYKIGVRASNRVLEIKGAQIPGGYCLKPKNSGLTLEKL